jgi:DNA-binding response OmpR family regulator
VARVLVVEDEPTIAAALQDDLELEGYSVEVAGDGAAALERARSGAFDLILLDIMLPRKDGFTVCRELRGGGNRTPIILLTARGQEIDKVLGLELGADDYVTKPFSSRELQARIKAVLRRTAEQQLVSTCEFGDIIVDFDRCEVMRGGKKVELTAQEFKLLRAFIEHRGRVLSIDDLLARAWGTDVFLTDRVVYTHVNNLRAKIEDDPSQPKYLVSVRGLGYRFDG